jgi:hypothetical protein
MPKGKIPEIYSELVKEFLRGEMAADEFSLAVLGEYKRERRFFDEAESAVMNQLFYAAEDYCGDPELRDEGDLDEQQLADAAREFLAAIKVLDGDE